jgi:two-component system NtrC family sensor kinase
MAASKDQSELLDQVDEQLRRVSEISHQTLRFSKPSQIRSFNVGDVVVATLRLLGPKLALSSLKAETDIRSTSELLCSPGELQQILTNILNNAAEASDEPRKAKIRVSSRQSERTNLKAWSADHNRRRRPRHVC